jgi:hypothetical protein
VNVPATIAKMIPRLASDHDGEVVATARAIERVLKSAGADWHDLAALCSPVHAPPIQPTQPWRRMYPDAARASDAAGDDWQKMARHCWARRDQLRPREQEFIRSMLVWFGMPTERQQDWLSGIYAQLMRHEAAG